MPPPIGAARVGNGTGVVKMRPPKLADGGLGASVPYIFNLSLCAAFAATLGDGVTPILGQSKSEDSG